MIHMRLSEKDEQFTDVNGNGVGSFNFIDENGNGIADSKYTNFLVNIAKTDNQGQMCMRLIYGFNMSITFAIVYSYHI